MRIKEKYVEILATEEQQIQAIKKWFQNNGRSLIWTLAIGVAIVLGIKYWMHHNVVVSQRASDAYNLMLLSIKSGDKDTLSNKGQQLLKQYPKTPYAALAALALAKQSLELEAFEEAQAHFQWVIDHSKDEDFKIIAQVRLARILFYQNKTEQALKNLQELESNGYKTLVQEIKGDMLLSQKEYDQAKVAYEAAVEELPQNVPSRPLLNMKLQDLGGSI